MHLVINKALNIIVKLNCLVKYIDERHDLHGSWQYTHDLRMETPTIDHVSSKPDFGG